MHLPFRPSTTDAETNTTKSNNLDTEEQVSSREWIKCFYKKYPNWVALRIQPIRKKTGSEDQRYILGDKGSLITIRTGKKSKTYGSLDWVATESKIRDIWYEGESQSIDEVGSMRDEENRTRTVLRLGKKRSGDELEELDVVLKDRRLPNITFDKKITSTTSDDERSRFKMLWIISKNMEMVESNGLIKSIIPVFKDKYKSDKSSLEQYVWVKDGSVDVFGKESNLKHTTALKKIDWQSTLREFLKMVEDRGLVLTMLGADDFEKTVKDYKPYDDDGEREARHGTKIGLIEDENIDGVLSIPDSEAKKMLYEYYKSLFDNKAVIPFRLHHVVDSTTGLKTHDTYYFGVPSESPYFNIIRTTNLFLERFERSDEADALDAYIPCAPKRVGRCIIREIIFKNADDVKQQSEEVYEESELVKLHDDAERAFLKYGEAVKQSEIIQKQEKEAEIEARKSNTKRTKSALKAARSAVRASLAAVRATKSVYSAKYKNTLN
ncbi:unnamed protein product [Phytophthora lilii]|uniref:Unnamed protein product n=1 Tax=Phytophthora lilii TaxID=2077276 RepID=A0A9W7CRU4_9STRA|nr:unnamed protein product [Phytophthora lilii]